MHYTRDPILNYLKTLDREKRIIQSLWAEVTRMPEHHALVAVFNILCAEERRVFGGPWDVWRKRP